jgi:hypothetical protein
MKITKKNAPAFTTASPVHTEKKIPPPPPSFCESVSHPHDLKN